MVGGSVVRKVEVVSRLVSPVGRVRTTGLPRVVDKVQSLVRARS